VSSDLAESHHREGLPGFQESGRASTPSAHSTPTSGSSRLGDSFGCRTRGRRRHCPATPAGAELGRRRHCPATPASAELVVAGATARRPRKLGPECRGAESPSQRRSRSERTVSSLPDLGAPAYRRPRREIEPAPSAPSAPCTHHPRPPRPVRPLCASPPRPVHPPPPPPSAPCAPSARSAPTPPRCPRPGARRSPAYRPGSPRTSCIPL
jgi:hypothetical protein